MAGPAILALGAFPNPNPGCLRVKVEGHAETLAADFYSAAMVKVGHSEGPGGSGWVSLGLPPGWGARPNGLYFVRVSAASGARRSTAAGRLQVLR